MSNSSAAEDTRQRESTKGGVFARRTLLVGAAGLAGAAGVGWLTRRREPVFVARNQRYDGPLEITLRDGLLATGFDPKSISGKRVLLKPNMVEPARDRPQMTTHPAVVMAAVHLFRNWGADVLVGEAPGHVRDTMMALSESGIGEALRESKTAFADLNYERIRAVPNLGRTCRLEEFYFPGSVATADLLVSLPKMKTHHWMGMTASLKNFYGVLPGIKYGWPKNVLHFQGIPETVVDINASLPRTLAIVDGIECMEGDGPILGSSKRMGLLIVGRNLPAVDATIARIMGLRPDRIPYLRLAAQHLGPINDGRIQQRGERWQTVVSPFKILDREHLRPLRATQDGPLVS